MKSIKVIAAIALIAMLGACAENGGSGSKNTDGSPNTVSTDSSGNCSTQFISAYNSVIFEATMLKSYIDRKASNSEIFHQAQVLKNACEQLFPVHENVSCKAIIDYKETAVSSNDLVPKCKAGQSILDLQTGSN